MRNIVEIINKIIGHIPTDNNEVLIQRLITVADDSVYRSPELKYMTWADLSEVLNYYIGEPKEEWHFEVFSILTALSVEQLEQELGIKL